MIVTIPPWRNGEIRHVCVAVTDNPQYIKDYFLNDVPYFFEQFLGNRYSTQLPEQVAKLLTVVDYKWIFHVAATENLNTYRVTYDPNRMSEDDVREVFSALTFHIANPQ
jgi:hypothetical protein